MEFNKLKKKLIYLVILSILSANVAYARSDAGRAGDVLQIAIPLSAFGISYFKGDSEGQVEFAKSFATTMAISYALKYSLKNSSWGTRPEAGKYSFPSGHTSSAFGGAFYLQQRYGYAYGAPSMVLAAFTGYSRIADNKHHWRDVIGSTIIAAGANYYFVSKYNKPGVNLSADIDSKTAILNLSYNF